MKKRRCSRVVQWFFDSGYSAAFQFKGKPMELNCHRTEYHEDVMAWGGKGLGQRMLFPASRVISKKGLYLIGSHW
jgi:hypothetical protein